MPGLPLLGGRRRPPTGEGVRHGDAEAGDLDRVRRVPWPGTCRRAQRVGGVAAGRRRATPHGGRAGPATQMREPRTRGVRVACRKAAVPGGASGWSRCGEPQMSARQEVATSTKPRICRQWGRPRSMQVRHAVEHHAAFAAGAAPAARRQPGCRRGPGTNGAPAPGSPAPRRDQASGCWVTGDPAPRSARPSISRQPPQLVTDPPGRRRPVQPDRDPAPACSAVPVARLLGRSPAGATRRRPVGSGDVGVREPDAVRRAPGDEPAPDGTARARSRWPPIEHATSTTPSSPAVENTAYGIGDRAPARLLLEVVSPDCRMSDAMQPVAWRVPLRPPPAAAIGDAWWISSTSPPTRSPPRTRTCASRDHQHGRHASRPSSLIKELVPSTTDNSPGTTAPTP